MKRSTKPMTKPSTKSRVKKNVAPRNKATAVDVDTLLAIGRTDFLSFVLLVCHILAPHMVLKMNWHLRAMTFHLEEVLNGNIKRLIMTLPPRHLKSIITSIAFPAFVLGHDPTKSVIVASYSASLASKLHNDFRTVVESAIFRKLFPLFKVKKSTESEVVTKEGGGRIATSIDGPVTGRGCDWAIIDDPLKPNDAWSEVRRQRVNDWYYQTLQSRLNEPSIAAIILVMQRLHAHDLAGTLEADDDWVTLKLPAIAMQDSAIQIGPSTTYYRKEGEPLHDARVPIEMLERIKERSGSEIWGAQYQQAPLTPGGKMIKSHWPRRYELGQHPRSGMIVQSLDTAIKAGPQNDYSALTTWVISEKNYWLIDVARRRLEYPQLKSWVLENARKHKPLKILIEDAGTGSALIQELRHCELSTVPVKPTQDKLTRMQIAAAKFESGKVYIPVSAPWLPDLELELFTFPQSVHDDQIDSISQLLNTEFSTYDPGAVAEAIRHIFTERERVHPLASLFGRMGLF